MRLNLSVERLIQRKLYATAFGTSEEEQSSEVWEVRIYG
jgi:hypothetical protein